MNADASVQLPGSWVGLLGAISTDTASSTVSFAAPGSTGPFSGSVEYRAVGKRNPFGTLDTKSDVMAVTANVVSCGPVITDTTPPVTTKAIGAPKYDAGDKYVTSSSTFTLTCTDDSGSCAGTFYKVLAGMNQACPSNAAASEGLWNPYSGPFTLTGSDGDYTVCFYSRDSAGNREAPNHQNHYLDNTAPVMTITTPASTYVLGQVVIANYACVDAGSGVSTCAGPVANGAAIDTATLGSKSFTVNSTDHLGNASAKTVTYSVVYKVCALFDQTKLQKAGSTVPIKIQLCDINGNNLSSSSIAVTAFSLSKLEDAPSSYVEDSGRANPEQSFRYDAPNLGYVFNLSTKSPSPAHGTTTALDPGTWKLGFKASTTGNQVYYVQFDVR